MGYPPVPLRSTGGYITPRATRAGRSLSLKAQYARVPIANRQSLTAARLQRQRAQQLAPERLDRLRALSRQRVA